MEIVTPVSFESIIIFGGLFIVSNLKVHLKVRNIFPYCSLIVMSFGQGKKIFYATLESFEVIDIE